MKKLLCFDMDGTLCNLYGVTNWLEKLRLYDATPYIEAEPLFDMQEIVTILCELKRHAWEIAIISWLSLNSTNDYDKAVRQAKRGWLAKYNFPADSIHIVKYGTAKHNVIRKKEYDKCILFDDDKKVRDKWTIGTTINPKNTNIVQVLEKLLKMENINI